MSLLSLLIDTGEVIPLSDIDIKQICYNETQIISYDQLLKVKDIYDLLEPFNNFVLFYQTTSRNVGHWVTVILHKERNMIEFFDSYGLNDEQILVNCDTSELISNGKPILTYLIQQAQRTYGFTFTYNNEQLQSADFGYVNTCGRYAALRARFCYLSLENFKSLVRDSRYGSDFIVTALTIMFNEDIDEIITQKVGKYNKKRSLPKKNKKAFIQMPTNSKNINI